MPGNPILRPDHDLPDARACRIHEELVEELGADGMVFGHTDHGRIRAFRIVDV